MCDYIERQEAMLEQLTYGTMEHNAVMCLDLFTKCYCRDETVTDDLVFRCSECEFLMPDDRCKVKVMARKLCPQYKEFGCMGDL